MSWKQFRFGTGGALIGVREEPEEADASEPFWITFPGLGQAMSEKNYLFSNLRKRMALRRARMFQFDYRGHGDSEGELGDTSLSAMVEDALEAAAFAAAGGKPRKLYLVGHALGAVVALLAAAELKRREGPPCALVLISPPFAPLPQSADLFDPETLCKLKRTGKIDSQELMPGYDYYTLSDFDPRQYDYFTRLGSHMLYLHGQCIGGQMLDELDELDTMALAKAYLGPVTVICGEHDEDTILFAKELPVVDLRMLKGVRYFHQHPAAMDDLIGLVEQLWLSGSF